jgi:hypothetical protein
MMRSMKWPGTSAACMSQRPAYLRPGSRGRAAVRSHHRHRRRSAFPRAGTLAWLHLPPVKCRMRARVDLFRLKSPTAQASLPETARTPVPRVDIQRGCDLVPGDERSAGAVYRRERGDQLGLRQDRCGAGYRVVGPAPRPEQPRGSSTFPRLRSQPPTLTGEPACLATRRTRWSSTTPNCAR